MTEQGMPPTDPQQPGAPQEPPAPQETPPAAPAEPAPVAQTATAPPPPAVSEPPKKKGGWGKWVAIGCGCLFIVVLAIALILGAIAVPTFMRAKDAQLDVQVMSKLRNGGTAAAMYAANNNGSFEGIDAAVLAKSDSSVSFENGTPSPDMKVGVIYVDKLAAGATKYSIAVKSESGTIYRMTYDNGSAKIEKSTDGATWTDVAKS